MSKFCYIVGAGNTDGMYIGKSGTVIAADGGLKHLEEIGVKPDAIIGDFDSLGYVPTGDNVTCYPAEKDSTDVMLAFKKGLEQKCDTFIVYGGLGGRIDHTLANIQYLSYMVRKCKRAYFVGKGMVITVICDDTITFDDTHEGIVSVFCGADIAEGVTIKGLKYELKNATLYHRKPLGVSNEFVKGRRSRITVNNGDLTVMWTENAENFVKKLENKYLDNN